MVNFARNFPRTQIHLKANSNQYRLDNLFLTLMLALNLFNLVIMKHFLKSKLPLLLTIILISFLLFSCADNEKVTFCLSGQTYGFFGGIWHGMIAPFDLIAMLFSDDVSVFAPNNSGAWYAFGFLIGSGGWGFLGGKGSKK